MANQLGGYWKLAETIKGIVPNRSAKPTTAVVRNIDEDGTVWVAQSGSDEMVPITGVNVASVNVDDVITIDAGNGRLSITGNATEPAVGERTVSTTVERVVGVARTAINTAINVANNIANEAKEVAEAINQHFWTDDAGIHVSQETKENFAENGGPNILVNSSGVLLRNALNWLAQLTPGAVAFYDGSGNSASNLMGSFGPSGVRQYVAGVLRSLLNVDGLTIYDALGHVVGQFGDSARIGPSDSYVYIDGYRFYFRDIDSDPSFLINSKSYSYSESMYIDPETEVWPQIHPSFDFPFFVDSYTVTLDGGVDDTANWEPEDSNIGATTITNYSAGTWETYAGRTLTFNGSISEGAFVRNIITALGGYYLCDSSNTRYPAITDNGNNLWIGSRSSSSTHHTGKTYISAGHDGTAGNSTIYVSVPNAANNAANNYGVYHTGNKPALTDLSGTLATTHGGTGSTTYGATETDDVSAAVELVNESWGNIGIVSLTTGTWIITYGVQFAANATGRRHMCIYNGTGTPSATFQRATEQNANAVSSGATYLHGSHIATLSSDMTMYLKGWQNSGTRLSAYGYIKAFKLK